MKNSIIDRKGDPVLIEATALTPIVYKHTFGGDMLKDMTAIRNGSLDKNDIFDLCAKCAFIMSKQVTHNKDLAGLMSLKIEDFYEFLNDFESNSFMTEETQAIIFGTWFNNANVIDKVKNPQSPPNEN